ncbi:1647a71f-48b4-43d4-98e2-4a316216dd2c [Sclerotinia trifoliorum]|uniref:1647a71f-48b4-43d4-98e2-4a316216dd2c n=1 Tax=Sclerotinia trifoliorum TaxID=28548 RepID=A0A8H2W4N8_9HELO|nr:1647a71f-48b4-43d4-98e2-4a316216dd2c [Sclerotinia trifoliorum]
MPRLVRRRPLRERITDWFNIHDWVLWISEEIETRDWDSKAYANPLAFGLHSTLLIARANSGNGVSGNVDDVFGDVPSGTGWLSYLSTLVVYLLTALSILNAISTFSRKRRYRLFESSIEAAPSTPSAQRVRIDSSPVSSSPLRFFSTILGDTNAQSRAHPDPTRDVWEIAVWDPIPVCLRLFCLFSPGHVLVYWLFLPTLSSDSRPSVTIFTTLVLELLMTGQLLLLQTNFSQQEKDTSIIQKEVMSEYDIKFVHPRMNPVMRDVGTQFSGPDAKVKTGREEEIEIYTPSVVLKKGFRTNPNPNYSKFVDPDSVSPSKPVSRQIFSPAPSFISTSFNKPRDSPYNRKIPNTAMRQPQFRQTTPNSVTSTSAGTADGGSLGIYSHANSPLKKTSSMFDNQGRDRRDIPKSSLDMAGREIRDQRERESSPKKRVHGGSDLRPFGKSPFPDAESDRRVSDNFSKARTGNVDQSPYRRGPSRW